MAVTKEEIRIINEEMMVKFEKSMIDFITGSTKLQNEKMDRIESRLQSLGDKIKGMEQKYEGLHQKVEELKESLEFTQDNLIDQKINNIAKEVNENIKVLNDEFKGSFATYEGELAEQTQEKNVLKEKLRVLEDRNRRNNLRVDGLKENENETWEETEEKVHSLLRDKLQLQDSIVIERAHRMGKKSNKEGENGGKTRTIIFKLLNYKDKEHILRNSNKLKDTGIYINEDFSDETNEIRRELRIKMKENREAGKFSKIVYDRLITAEFKTKKQSGQIQS